MNEVNKIAEYLKRDKDWVKVPAGRAQKLYVELTGRLFDIYLTQVGVEEVIKRV